MQPDEPSFLQSLIDKYEQGTATDDEKRLLLTYYRSFDARRGLTEGLDDGQREALKKELRSVIHDRIQSSRVNLPFRKSQRWISYAAAVLLIVAVGVLVRYMLHDGGQQESSATTEILAGGNRATLRLADGRSIALDESRSGIIIADDIMYSDGSQLFVDDGGLVSQGHFQLATPKGGTYQVTLSDGSRVWLNADSRLIYPVRFEGVERVVELEGEAYFEIEQGDKPFRVVSQHQVVEVLGTHFNVDAYPDEHETTTTLLEGGVKISGYAHDPLSTTLLRPGQQALVSGNEISISTIETNTATSWKDGYFHFINADLRTVMTEFARWYDIDVYFETERSGDEFVGQISRSVSLQNALKILEMGGVKFKAEGRVITIIE